MDNSLRSVRGINHKYIVVESRVKMSEKDFIDGDFREEIPEDEKRDQSVETSEIHPTNDHVNENITHTDHKDDYEDICYLCHRPESIAGKMIHIPNNISLLSHYIRWH